MIPRRAAWAATAVLLLVATTACAPHAAPTPTPTPAFRTEKEAFAAAEGTYRAYVDATNRVDLSDPKTFEAVYAWTVDAALSDVKKSLTRMHAEGWRVTGHTRFDHFTARALDLGNNSAIVEATLCLDVSAVDVTDASGSSVVPSTRRDRQPVIATFAMADTATRLAVAKSEPSEDEELCTS
jgi:hypothetical protein